MLIYILKFSACLAVFFGFYKLFLENENMHQFKRYYLIGVIIISISIPLITFTQYIEPIVLENADQKGQVVLSQNLDLSNGFLGNYLPSILWSLYGIGVLLFGIKFLTNLSNLILKIKRNPKCKSHHFINVLLQDSVTPHTFFSYIFLNKYRYETQQIPKEVLLHEETHAKQKHSVDVLLIEILQIIFWFNPLIYFIKNSIKLNHEFLADKAVLQKGIKPSNYQQILLAFSTNQKEPQLANAINYSSIKKRFTVMKTQTSKQKIWYRSILLLPVLAFTLYGFSEHKEVINKSDAIENLERSQNDQDGATKEQIAEYNRLAKHYNSQSKDRLIIKQKDLERLEYLYHLMSDKQKKNAEPFPVLPPPPAPDAPINIKADKIFPPPPPPPPMPENATPEQKEKYNKVIEEYKRKYTVKEGRVYENPPPPPPPIPENATSDQRKKYEDATKSYKLRTKENDLSRTRTLRSKEDASRLRKDKLATKEVRAAKLRTEKQDRAQVKERQSKDRVLKLREDELRMKKDRLASKDAQKERHSKDEILARDREMQMRESPRATLDHVVDMAKKNAKFFLEGKAISSDKAIESLKKNEALNIKIVDSKSKKPKVYISKKPIQIEN